MRLTGAILKQSNSTAQIRPPPWLNLRRKPELDLLPLELDFLYGADPNKANDDGETPLYRAARIGETKIVKALLEAGADPNKSDNSGCTPLYWAAAAVLGKLDDVKLLLAAGWQFNRFFDRINHGPTHP